MNNFKLVSEKVFIDFIKNYKKKLVIDVNGIYEPPLVTYNDFSIGEFPKSIVAKFFKDTDDKRFKIIIIKNEI